MDDELKKELERKKKEQKQLLDDWLDKFGKASQIAPFVQQARDQTQQHLEAISTMPEAVAEIPHDHLLGIYSREKDYWSYALPPIPEYDESVVASGTAISASASLSTYEFVTRASELDDPSARAWGEEHAFHYMRMQREQQRKEQVRGVLAQLNPDRVAEFDEAIAEYERAISGWSSRTAAGIALRNVLEHVKGDLFEKAINRPGEQKIQWADMAVRLAKGKVESNVLLAEELTYRSLHQRLTDIAKNLQAGVATNLEMVFTEWIDHLYTVLFLIDPKHY